MHSMQFKDLDIGCHLFFILMVDLIPSKKIMNQSKILQRVESGGGVGERRREEEKSRGELYE